MTLFDSGEPLVLAQRHVVGVERVVVTHHLELLELEQQPLQVRVRRGPLVALVGRRLRIELAAEQLLLRRVVLLLRAPDVPLEDRLRRVLWRGAIELHRQPLHPLWHLQRRRWHDARDARVQDPLVPAQPLRPERGRLGREELQIVRVRHEQTRSGAQQHPARDVCTFVAAGHLEQDEHKGLVHADRWRSFALNRHLIGGAGRHQRSDGRQLARERNRAVEVWHAEDAVHHRIARARIVQ